MTWTPLATITVQQDWQFTPVIASHLGYVRLTFGTAGVPVWVAQADPDSADIYDERRILATPHSRILEFVAPPFFDDRVLAVRLPIFSTPWNIEFEVSSMPISRGNSTPPAQPVISANCTVSTVGAQTDSRVLLAANANRKFAVITNLSPGILTIDFAGTASSGLGPVQLYQGDMYELPIAFTGAISGAWSAAGGSGAMIREFT